MAILKWLWPGGGRDDTSTGVPAIGLYEVEIQRVCTPEEVATLVRGHWEIKNRVHDPRDSMTTKTGVGRLSVTCRAI